MKVKLKFSGKSEYQSGISESLINNAKENKEYFTN